MHLIDLDQYPKNDCMYGGLGGAKIGITIDGEDYMVKYPQNLRDRETPLKNITISYANNPYSEYIGSHIYGMMGIPVHETLLGKRQGKIVVACKDFRPDGSELVEFRSIKTTYEPEDGLDRGSSLTDGSGMDIDDVLYIIRNHHVTRNRPEVMERFWQMFIIDAYIGNADRNNGNWGLLVKKHESIELAPIYDNGSCLNNKSNDEQMQEMLDDENMMRDRAYRAVTCYYKRNGKKFNPFHLLRDTTDPDCIRVMEKLIPRLLVRNPFIQEEIQTYDVIPQLKRDFYCKILDVRAKEPLTKIYQNMQARSSKAEIEKGVSR